MEPDPLEGDTDPINYSMSLEYRYKVEWGLNNNFIEVADFIIFRIRFHKLGSRSQPWTKQLLYVMCFAGVVGKRLWCCSRVVLLFLCFYIVSLYKYEIHFLGK